MEGMYLHLMHETISQIKRFVGALELDLKDKDCKQIEKDIEYLKLFLDLIKKINIKYGMENIEDMSFTIPVNQDYEKSIKILTEILKQKTEKSYGELFLSVSALIISIIALIKVII